MYTQPSQPVSRRSLSPTRQTSLPNNYASHHHIPTPFRQLHPPKSPLYRPAVLRAIEGPLRSYNSTSPKLASEDFLGDFKGESDLIRNCDDDIEDIEIDYFQEGEESGKVTGPPQRAHWKVSISWDIHSTWGAPLVRIYIVRTAWTGNALPYVSFSTWLLICLGDCSLILKLLYAMHLPARSLSLFMSAAITAVGRLPSFNYRSYSDHPF